MDVKPLTQTEYDHILPFLYHTVTPELQKDMARIRVQYIWLALDIIQGQPPSDAQTLAVSELHESLLYALQGIALKGVPQVPEELELILPHEER